jgi:hypothetical protein
MMLDASETNFSGFRGAVDQARLGFRRNQRWLINKFHRPVYIWKVHQWLGGSLDRINSRSGVNVFGHKWNPPAWKYIEPTKDAAADMVQQTQLLNSPRRIQANRGRNWDEVKTEIVDDFVSVIRYAKKEAQKINKEIDDGSPVDWRECMSPLTPDNVTASLQQLTEPAEPAPTSESDQKPDPSAPPNQNGRFHNA